MLFSPHMYGSLAQIFTVLGSEPYCMESADKAKEENNFHSQVDELFSSYYLLLLIFTFLLFSYTLYSGQAK